MREYDYFSGNILIIEYDIKHVQHSNYDKTASTTAGGVFLHPWCRIFSPLPDVAV
jgi:hypothetical protein